MQKIKYIFKLLVALIATFVTSSRTIVNLPFLASTASYQCMRNLGYNTAIIRVHEQNAVVPNALQSINNARSAGLQVQLAVFPCISSSIQGQVSQIINAIPRNLYNKIWVLPDGNVADVKCCWSGTANKTKLCEYMKFFVNEIAKHDIQAGAYMDNVAWTNIFGGMNNCIIGPPTQLWYHNTGNQNPDFNDFKPVAGWTYPTLKQFKLGQSICGVPGNLNYAP